MKRNLLLMALSCLLVLAGCNSANPSGNAPAEEQEPSLSAAESEDPGAPVEETPVEEDTGREPLDGENPFADLELNAYEDLELTAAVLDRMAILPGRAVPVHITATNNGTQTLVYTLGSGVFETPQALSLQFSQLQPVIPKDHLGIMTMDFVVKELEPGDSLTFVLYVMMLEPNEHFDEYTYALYNDGEQYIADMDLEELLAAYPDLVTAQPGSYTGQVRFLYSVDGEGADPFGGPTGYAEAEIQLSVTD